MTDSISTLRDPGRSLRRSEYSGAATDSTDDESGEVSDEGDTGRCCRERDSGGQYEYDHSAYSGGNPFEHCLRECITSKEIPQQREDRPTCADDSDRRTEYICHDDLRDPSTDAGEKEVQMESKRCRASFERETDENKRKPV